MRLRSFSKTQWLALVVGVIFVIWLVVTLISIHNSSKPKVSDSGTYYDAWSHQTVSNPNGKTPDIYGTGGGSPVYLGIDQLVVHGLTSDQLSSLKLAFDNYSKSKNSSIKEVSFDVDHISSQHTASQFLMLFKVKFNRKDIYNAKVDYSNLTSIKLDLSDDKGVIVYSSGDVDATVGE
jgi:hypothetical protein